MSQGIAHEVNAAALPGRGENLRDGCLDAFMAVGDDELDAAQAAPRELAQKVCPEEPAPAKAGVSASEGPISMPSTSRRPSLLTPTATITATETIRPAWELHTFRALMEFPIRMDLWDSFTEIALNEGEDAAVTFYQANRVEMDEGAVLFWPVMKTLVALMYKRATSEDSFLSEDQNDPVSEGSPFKSIIFWANKLSNWMFFGTVDPSLGKHGKGRDPSAILVGGYDRTTGILDVVEASIRKRLPDLICSDVIDMQRRWNCVLWGVESVQFQEFLRTEIMVRAAKQGVALPAVPLMPIADKALRIERLQPPIAGGLIRLHASQTTLREQLQQWPNAAHDDGPDALEMLWMLALQHGSGGLNAGMIGAPVGRSVAGDGYRL